jgi:hypothetical protein
VAAVSGIFSALSTENSARFDSVSSQGFYIFEKGARLNRDANMGSIRDQRAAGKRYEWNVSDPDVHVYGVLLACVAGGV